MIFMAFLLERYYQPSAPLMEHPMVGHEGRIRAFVVTAER
jgi:hypothetical protein